ncbi:MAG: hypothetical protein AAB857_02685 [Patescibacteria group bacterium]
MTSGLVSLAFNSEGTWIEPNPLHQIPCHACLYREELVAERTPRTRVELIGKHLIWDCKSLRDINPEISFLSYLRTLTIVDMLIRERKLGIEIKGHLNKDITYFHGTEDQLAAVARELRTNTLYYHNGEIQNKKA